MYKNEASCYLSKSNIPYYYFVQIVQEAAASRPTPKDPDRKALTRRVSQAASPDLQKHRAYLAFCSPRLWNLLILTLLVLPNV